jgi:hypothetical protein
MINLPGGTDMDRAQLGELLRGALRVWRVDGAVTVAQKCCAIRAAGQVVTVMRVREEGDAPYWEVGVDDADGSPPQPCAGIHGMLRAVRDLLDPDSDAGRLIVGRVL